MTAQIGELSVDQYRSLADAAGRGRRNALLERASSLCSSRDDAIRGAAQFGELIGSFAARFGTDRRICLYESPGRVNLMGMHIDHRGGIVNPVATKQRIRAVCSRRDDDLIRAVSRSGGFGESEFRISDRLPERPLGSLEAWLNWTEEQAVLLDGGRDFINYFACGPLYAACFVYPWGRSFAGADFVLDSDLPPSAGLSSSSAVVILATDFFLRCNGGEGEGLPFDRLLEIYGHGEWYIGTRGGAGDHAAIKLARRGAVVPVITTPRFRALDPTRVPDGCDFVLYPSGDEANKSVEPSKSGFNAPIVAYQVGEMFLAEFLRRWHPDALESLLARRAGLDPKHRRVYLGDVLMEGLLSEAEVYRFLRGLPRGMRQTEVLTRFADQAEIFQTGFRQFREPPGGYAVRQVSAFGFSECARSRHASRVLAEGDIREFADMMNVSQLADCVRDDGDEARRRIKSVEDDALSDWEHENFPIRRISGAYLVSTSNIDRLTAACLSCPKVLAARLSGAGLGGMVIVLGETGFDEALDPILERAYYEPLQKPFRKIRIPPSQGAAIL